MEECIVSVNRKAAVYWYKSIQWQNFIHIVLFVFACIGMLIPLITFFIPAEVLDFVDKVSDGVLGVKFTLFISIASLVVNSSLLYGSLLGILSMKKCKHALISGDDNQLESGLKQCRAQNQIIAFTLIIVVGVLLSLLITLLMIK